MESLKSRRFRGWPGLIAALLVMAGGLAGLPGSPAWGLEPKDQGSYLQQKEFFKPELYISSSHVPIEEILGSLPNGGAWESYFAAREKALKPGDALPRVFIDPRSGAVTSLIDSVPLIPGRGLGNRVQLADLSAKLGRTVEKVDSLTVSEAVLAWVLQHVDVLKIDPAQLGAVRSVRRQPPNSGR